MVLTIAPICFRRFAGTFGEALHFLGDDGEAAPGFPGRSGLDGGIERQYVGLLGDVGNQFDDFTDLL
jgi:hypothetical protein